MENIRFALVGFLNVRKLPKDAWKLFAATIGKFFSSLLIVISEFVENMFLFSIILFCC